MLKNKIVVGILPTYNYKNEENSPYNDIAYFVRMYEEKIKECGAIAIGLLNNDISIYKDICDAYIWPGGKVIHKELYVVFDDILKNKKPLLGICLGSQAIATFFNVLEDQVNNPNLSLIEIYDSNKMDDLYLKKLDNDSLTLHSNNLTKDIKSINNAKHEINIKKNTFMYDIYKETKISVVSLHSYAIARISKDIIVSSLSNDNIIESIEYKKDNNHILGIQYHPEVNNDYKPFIWLIEQAYNKYKLIINKDNKFTNNSFKLINYTSNYPNISDNESFIEEQTLYAFLKLKDKMLDLGFIMDLQSGYRSKILQEKIFNDTKKEKGIKHANMFVAKPGYSEHQSGLAVDVCACINGKWYIEFAKELDIFYKVLHKYCADYGFILRYKKNKEDITGYAYEPWHLRYVGSISLAKKIMEKDLVLEEI